MMTKNHIFKRLSAFVLGMLTMAALVPLTEPVLAAGEKIAYNQIGIRVMREQRVEAGENYTAPNGQQVPSSITYTDAAGGKTNYLSVRQLSDLLDMEEIRLSALQSLRFLK